MDGGMNSKQQAYVMLKDFVSARKVAPWTAGWFTNLAENADCWMGPRRCIQRLGGMASDWNYSERELPSVSR